MGRALGIELTESEVRLCAVEPAGKKIRILGVHAAPVAPGETPWEERASAALKDALAASKLGKARPVASLDSGLALLREVSLPFKGDEQVRKTVRFEMESLIHNYAIEQLVVAHVKTGETDKGTMLLAAAVPKDRLGAHLKIHQNAGADPVAVDLDVAAVFNAMHRAGAVDPAAPQLLLYGTPRFTKLVFIEEGKPKAIRTLRFSLGGPSEPLPSGDAPAGGEEPVLVVADDEPAKEGPDGLARILSKEISRFLLAGAAGAQPESLLLAGDFDRDDAARRIEDAVGIPVKRVDVLKAVDPQAPSADSSRYAAALGLALKGVGEDVLGLDFRQDEFQYARKFEALRNTALITLQLVVVLLAAVALHFFLQRRELGDAAKTVLGEHKKLAEDVLGQEVGDAVSAYPRMAELYRQAQAATGRGDTPLVESARTAWIELFNAIQRFQQRTAPQKLGGAELFLEIEQVDVQQATAPGTESLTMTLRGKIRNHEYAGALRNEVRASGLFPNADWSGPIQPTENGLYQFTLKSTLAKKDRRT